MRKDIPLSELTDWLALPLVAVLATYRRDGGVLLSPVWHRFRDGGFDVVSFPGDIKVRHLANDPRASFLLYDQAPPLRGLELVPSPSSPTSMGRRSSATWPTAISARKLATRTRTASVRSSSSSASSRVSFAPGISRATSS